MKSLSVIAFIIMVLALVALIARGELWGQGAIAITVQVAAVLLMIWSRLTFGLRSFHAAANPTEGGLVTTGPYKFIRHPIYAAVVYFIVAGVLCRLTIETVILALVAFLGTAGRIYAEEKLLVRKYPDYAMYAARTRRIIPYLL
jgi:protein-S-isoprenylcysteine O-methyltransferase Ste14